MRLCRDMRWCTVNNNNVLFPHLLRLHKSPQQPAAYSTKFADRNATLAAALGSHCYVYSLRTTQSCGRESSGFILRISTRARTGK
jgi:hypothetical protein